MGKARSFSEDRAELGREAFLLAHLEDILGDVEDARESSAMTAMSRLQSLALVVRNTLDECREKSGALSDDEDLPEDEYVRRLEESARGWPDQHLEIIVKVYQERHNLPALVVIEGGRS